MKVFLQIINYCHPKSTFYDHIKVYNIINAAMGLHIINNCWHFVIDSHLVRTIQSKLNSDFNLYCNILIIILFAVWFL